jgi:MFS family permease
MGQVGRFSRDYWTYWFGQTVSTAGDAVTAFAMPLLVYNLTGSALKLSFAMVAFYLPYLLFGLPIGAWVDRVDRKRLMIVTDVLRVALMASIPIAAALHLLTPWGVYAVTFLAATLGIAFNAAAFAAVPFLVPDEAELARANGRLQAASSAAALAAPALGGLGLTIMKPATLVLADAVSYAVSAASLMLVRGSFHVDETEPRTTSLLDEVRDGLRYVFNDKVLRSLAIMAVLVNLFFATTLAQIVLLAKDALGASNAGVGAFFSAGEAGIIIASVLAPRLLRAIPDGRVIVGATIANGLFTLLLSQSHSLPIGVVAYGGLLGMASLYRVSTATLRQRITPPHLMGRAITTAMVLAWSVVPLGAVAGGAAIEKLGSVRFVYAITGSALVAIGIVFAFGRLGRAPSEPRRRNR